MKLDESRRDVVGLGTALQDSDKQTNKQTDGAEHPTESIAQIKSNQIFICSRQIAKTTKKLKLCLELGHKGRCKQLTCKFYHEVIRTYHS